MKKSKLRVVWVEPIGFARDRLRDTHRHELRSLIGIAAWRLNPSYDELNFFTASADKKGFDFDFNCYHRVDFFKRTSGTHHTSAATSLPPAGAMP